MTVYGPRRRRRRGPLGVVLALLLADTALAAPRHLLGDTTRMLGTDWTYHETPAAIAFCNYPPGRRSAQN